MAYPKSAPVPPAKRGKRAAGKTAPPAAPPVAVAVPASPNLPEVERRVLDYWASDKTFLASVETRDAGVDCANEFLVYDGPPFTNGLPHYGHMPPHYVKDVVPRYHTSLQRR